MQTLYRHIKLGKVRVNKDSPPEHRFWAKVDKNGPKHPTLKTKCWIWLGVKGRGKKCYGGFQFCPSKYGLAHRFSWILHKGPIPEGLLVLHRCDNPACVRPSHLFVGTAHDNNMDCLAKGRQVSHSGETNGNSKLTEAQVLEIRSLYKYGEYGCSKLSKRFGVTRKLIHDIVNRRIWKHLPDMAASC